MAFVSKEKKSKIKAALDLALKGTDVKYTLAVNNHSTIVCTVKSSSIDFIGNFQTNHVMRMAREGAMVDEAYPSYLDINPYWYQDSFTGEAFETIKKILGALNTDNFDKSDPQTDYFHVGHYVDLNIGKWDKPYKLKAK